ncbi:MAG TPA: LysE family transporter [Flavobacterium sp.]|uniref:LysE family transporter n=1 Tax=unclassified Flavobacterium TaxID=196869 RepID=UPI0025B830C7|nr:MULTISPECIES: LysE family transporter [unclassified Flavobacterium]HRE77557.1 LysE family transporter [Flavobacterium sp.]
MNLTLPIILGLSAAAIGTTPPGLLNMTAAKVSMRDGRNRALWFAFGASIIVFFQTLLAVLFARFIDRRADISAVLQEIGLVIFTVLTVYFLWIAKKPKTKKKKEEIKMRSKSSRFFLGMLLSLLNLFPIPYYVFVSITLGSYGYFNFDTFFIYSFSAASAIAAFLVFFGYISFFKGKEKKDSFLSRNINYVIGSITGIVALITLFKIFSQ